jgi:hypothetical protein
MIARKNRSRSPQIRHIAGFIVSMLLASVARAGAPVFDTSTVRADGEWNNPSSIAVDANGVVHMAYMTQHHTDSTTKDIWYATNACGTWTHQQLTFNAVREEFPYLVLDSAGNVHIAFHTGTATSNMIRYVNNVDARKGTFNSIIDITGSGYKIVRHAVDSTGNVHFVFTTQTANLSDDVHYTTWDLAHGVGALTPLQISANGDSAPDIAIGPASGEVIHVVWAAGAISGPLRYMNNSSGSFQTVNTGVVANVQSPIVLVSPTNIVHIVYRVSDMLWTVNDQGGSFSAPQLVYGGSYRPSFYNKFALDADGLLHIAYASNANTDRGIFYIRQSSPFGLFDAPVPVLSNPSGNQGVSLALGAASDVNISYSISGSDPKAGTVFANIFHAAEAVVDPCPADVTDNNQVNIDDLLDVINGWGGADPGDVSDIDGNCVVNIDDLLAVINAWGACP